MFKNGGLKPEKDRVIERKGFRFEFFAPVRENEGWMQIIDQ